MVRVAPIRLAFNPRTLWFDPRDLDIHNGDDVVVLTARGVEFGHAAGDVFEIDEDQVKKLKSPLKPVKRIATPEDVERAGEMERLGREALPIFKEMAAQANEDMHPVSVEYLLEGDKAVFYFEAEERVDFRELVRKLACVYVCASTCARSACATRLAWSAVSAIAARSCAAPAYGEFCPVSIRMAKEQDLSLNPQKISGVCGRLMCCLRYEFDAYKDFKSRAPKQNATVKTPDGPAKVVDLDVPREVVSVRLRARSPFACPFPPSMRPRRARARTRSGRRRGMRRMLPTSREFMSNALFSTDQFTGRDKLAEAGSVRRTGSSKRSRKGAQASTRRRAASRAPNRRSTKVSAESDHASKQDSQEKKQDKQASRSSSSKRKPRRRSDQKTGEAKQGKQSAERSAKHQKPQRAKEEGRGQQKSGPRPGQKSSGLRAKPQKQASSSGSRQQGEGGQRPAQGGAPSQNEHRRARRRSHKAGGSSQNEG